MVITPHPSPDAQSAGHYREARQAVQDTDQTAKETPDERPTQLGLGSPPLPSNPSRNW